MIETYLSNINERGIPNISSALENIIQEEFQDSYNQVREFY